MIIKELYTTRPDGVKLFLNYSDKGVYIRQDQTGIEYTEAIDVEAASYTYTETDKPIEGEPQDEAELKSAAYDYLTGRSNGNE